MSDALAPLSVSRSTISARLKKGTTRIHESVDQRVMAANPFADIDRYGLFLHVQHQFHAAMKSLYQDSQLNGWLPGLAALSRLDAVEADLIALDKPLPEKPPAVSPQSPYAALGWLYCCEGSNIGAAFLAKEVAAIGLNEAHGAAHLASPPQGRATHWRRFRAQLDSLELTGPQAVDAIDGAKDAFALYHRLLDATFGPSKLR